MGQRKALSSLCVWPTKGRLCYAHGWGIEVHDNNIQSLRTSLTSYSIHYQITQSVFSQVLNEYKLLLIFNQISDVGKTYNKNMFYITFEDCKCWGWVISIRSQDLRDFRWNPTHKRRVDFKDWREIPWGSIIKFCKLVCNKHNTLTNSVFFVTLFPKSSKLPSSVAWWWG